MCIECYDNFAIVDGRCVTNITEDETFNNSMIAVMFLTMVVMLVAIPIIYHFIAKKFPKYLSNSKYSKLSFSSIL